jgi:replicative DNA helicase
LGPEREDGSALAMRSPAEILAKPAALPEAREAEMSMLGCLIVNNAAVKPVLSAGVMRSAFARPAHAEIFAALLRLHEVGKPIDLVLLRDELARSGKLEAVGGIEYVASLAEQVPGTSTESALAYADDVLEAARRRKASQLARRFEAAVASGKLNGEAGALRQALEELERPPRGGLVPTTEPKTAPELQEERKIAGAAVKYPLRLQEVNEALGGGVPSGAMVGIAGFSNTGKSTLLRGEMLHGASLGHPTLFLSLEETRLEAAGNLEAMNDGEPLPANLWIWDASRDLGAIVPVIETWIDLQDSAALPPEVGIDFQQLVSVQGESVRYREVEKAAYTLQALARRRGFILVSACQLNRRSQEEGTRPKLHHLREAGIEQPLDVCLLIAQDAPDRLWMSLAKSRYGPKGQEWDFSIDYRTGRMGPVTAAQTLVPIAQAIVAYLQSAHDRRAKVREVYRNVRVAGRRISLSEVIEAASATSLFQVGEGAAWL